MPNLIVNGDRLHFTDEGDGTVVLLVHGSCGGSAQWRRFSEFLGPGYRKIAVDLPGMGDSDPYPLGRVWTSDVDVAAIAAVIEHISEPIHFVGHSGGCLFSWKALQAHAVRLQSLTLFEPVFFDVLHDVDDPLHAWPRQMADGYRGLVDAGDLEGALSNFVDGWAGAEGAWASLPAKVQDMMRKGGPRLYFEWGERLTPDGKLEDLAEPAVPTLLVEGSRTHAVMNAICGHFASVRPDVKRLKLKGAGHMGPFTHAEEAATATRAHIAEVVAGI
ncbi:MAG: alpha/beta fold hydrolase [Pseudomonadota bacterium]